MTNTEHETLQEEVEQLQHRKEELQKHIKRMERDEQREQIQAAREAREEARAEARFQAELEESKARKASYEREDSPEEKAMQMAIMQGVAGLLPEVQDLVRILKNRIEFGDKDGIRAAACAYYRDAAKASGKPEDLKELADRLLTLIGQKDNKEK